MTLEITRSAGLPTGYGGYIAGGGYSGATKGLDETVQRAAKALTRSFKRDVEIRFNSHRQSGGAWLKDDLPGFSGSAQVGLGAALRPQPPKGKSKDEWYRELGRKHGSWTRGMLDEIEAAPKHVVVDTYIAGSVLKRPGLANSGNPDHRYASHNHRSIAEGLAFLLTHVNTIKLADYKGQHVLSLRAPAGKRRARRGSSKKRTSTARTVRGLR